MNDNRSADIAVVGAGIVGLAHAYIALKKGFRVVLFDRDQFAVSASVRNFGLIWPIGQQPGNGLELALNSRKHWLEVARQAGIWINTNGSLHLAYHEDEWKVLSEFVEMYNQEGFDMQLLDKTATLEKSPMVNPKGLIGSLSSNTECTVNPRMAIRKIPQWLVEQFGLQLRLGQQVKEINLPFIETPLEKWKVDRVFICSGTDFHSLYPESFAKHNLTKCKLQMMKAEVPESNFILGPSLCAGLTLRHYQSFSKCPSLKQVDERYNSESMEFKQHGIHVLLSQNNDGELIIGDSHEYGLTPEPFDKTEIDAYVLNYLKSFVSIPKLEITERWHGVYSKLPDANYWVADVESGVTIVNGLGGAGMTLSFGLADQLINDK